MALSSAYYPYSNTDGKLQEKLRWVFDYALHGNKAFEQSEAVKTISKWYKEVKQYKEEREEDGDNKHAILSSIANKTIDKLIEYVEPCYEGSIIKGIGIKTRFKEGSTQMNCNIEFVSIKPFVKFVKEVNEREVVSVTFRFQLDTSVYINKVQIHTNYTAAADKSIDIDKIGVKFELKLLQVTMSSMQMSVPDTSLNKPIKLVSKEFEIKNVSFNLRRSSTDKGPLSSSGDISWQKAQMSIMCENCGNRIQSNFNFCNICGTSIQSSCQNCGNTNPPSAVYCANCGSTLR
jgi:hypothetical protein